MKIGPVELEDGDVNRIADAVLDRMKLFLQSATSVDEILDKRGLAEYLKVDVSWIDRNLYAIPHFKPGKYVRFRRSHIDRWIEQNKKDPSRSLRLMKR